MENVPKDIIKISIPTEDPNEWRIFRGELAKLGITDENTVDTIQGLVSEMINKRIGREGIGIRKPISTNS